MQTTHCGFYKVEQANMFSSTVLYIFKVSFGFRYPSAEENSALHITKAITGRSM